MSRPLLALSLGFGIAILAAQLAFAEADRFCAPRPQVLERLAQTFGETRQSIGLGGDDQVVETFAATETGTWTIIVTLPTGMSCVVAAGRSFENLAEDLPPGGQPA